MALDPRFKAKAANHVWSALEEEAKKRLQQESSEVAFYIIMYEVFSCAVIIFILLVFVFLFREKHQLWNRTRSKKSSQEKKQQLT